MHEQCGHSSRPRIPERIRWTVDLLQVEPSEHLLEIGCGPGHAVALVCGQLRRGTITAIDRSAIQVRRARDRNRECIAAGRARIERVTLSAFAAGHRQFDRIFAVNVNAFWTEPARSIASLRHLIRPAGTVYLVYEPPSAARLREARETVPRLLRDHAFEVDDVRTQAFRAGYGLCIIGRPA